MQIKEFLKKLVSIVEEYRAPLIVFGLLTGAGLSDFVFRASDVDWYSKGQADMARGKYDAAIEEFSRALRQNPKDPASRFGLGWAYQSKGWNDDALKQYEMASKAASDTLYVSTYNTAVIFQQEHKLDAAAQSYQSALRLNPNAFDSNYNLGFIYGEKGMNAEAYAQFNKAIDLGSDSAVAHYNAGLIAEKLGRKDEARHHYERAISRDPGQTAASERLKALRD